MDDDVLLFFILGGRQMQVKRRLWLMFIAVLAVSMLLVACGDKDSGSGSGEYKDELHIALTAQPPTLDSAMTVSNVALDTANHIFETLLTMNENYEPTPMLAASVDVSDDGLVYTFKLREGIKFHNGKEMTAEDVEASMNRWVVTSSRAKTLLTNAKFEAVDTYEVKLTVERPSSDVLTILATRAQFPAIMPKEIIESAPAEGVAEYIGTGPYQFKEWRQDQYIHLVRYDDYQSLDTPSSAYAGKKEAPTENLYYHFVTDHSTRIAGVKTGQYDIALSIPTENYDELASDNNLELLTFPGGTLTAFLNTSEGLLSDVRYRQAVLAAMNNDEIMLASYAKEDLYSLAPGYMNTNQVLWHNDAGSEYYNQANAEKAKQLLADAGYDGEEITLLTTRDYGEMYTATLVIQEQLRQIGMNVKVENFDFPTFLETKNDRSKWDLFVASTGYQITPPQLLAVTPDWAGLHDATVADALVAIRGAATPEEAKQHWEELQGYLYEIGSSTVIGHYNNVVAISKSTEGFVLFESPIVWNAKVAK